MNSTKQKCGNGRKTRKHKYLNGVYPAIESKNNYFASFANGHGIDGLLTELILYSDDQERMQQNQMVAEGMKYLKTDQQFKEFISIITEFAKFGRYYYIDTVVKTDHNGINPFSKFEDFITSFYNGIVSPNLSYEQEDELAIGCIEKGASAIARFFTHGLGEMGKAFYADFAGFLLLKDEKLGQMEYAEKKTPLSESYKAMNSRSAKFLGIRLTAKSNILSSHDYMNWPFDVNKVKVYFTGKLYYFVEIDHKVYSLTAKTGNHYQIPSYFKSSRLKPKGHATFLLEEAKKLNIKN